jgi:LPXTG-site transpeptidase (sortase) family protein
MLMLQKIHFYSSIGALYLLTLGTIGALLYSSHLFGTPVWAKSNTVVATQPIAPIQLPPQVISGKPIRITIPDAGIDLPVSDGIYNPSDGSWTLSDTQAQFATMTSPANDRSGTTFIYGHGTDAVFGKIGTTRPATGTSAHLYTDNGYEFIYHLKTINDLNPNDTTIFDNTTTGSSQLVVQTCTGIFSEWRTMFAFSFTEVRKSE